MEIEAESLKNSTFTVKHYGQKRCNGDQNDRIAFCPDFDDLYLQGDVWQ